MKVFNKLIIFFIKLYQFCLSPMLGKNCRFHPSCSHYSVGCFKKYNLLYAGFLSLRRVLKCHPWGKSGYDPVP